MLIYTKLVCICDKNGIILYGGPTKYGKEKRLGRNRLRYNLVSIRSSTSSSTSNWKSKRQFQSTSFSTNHLRYSWCITRLNRATSSKCYHRSLQFPRKIICITSTWIPCVFFYLSQNLHSYSDDNFVKYNRGYPWKPSSKHFQSQIYI